MLDALIVLIALVAIGLWMLWKLTTELRDLREFVALILDRFSEGNVIQSIAASGRQIAYHLEELRKQSK